MIRVEIIIVAIEIC